MMNKKVLYFLLTVITVMVATVGCDNKRERIKDTLKAMHNQQIFLPLDRMKCRYGGKDTIVNHSTVPKLRMVVYLDSAYCTPCALDSIRLWNKLIADAGKYKGRLLYVFIAAPKLEQMEDTYFSIDDSQLDSPIYVDTAYAMRVSNPKLPDGKEYHTFLIDAKGNVLFVGNPLEKDLEELYTKTIRSYLIH